MLFRAHNLFLPTTLLLVDYEYPNIDQDGVIIITILLVLHGHFPARQTLPSSQCPVPQ